MCHGAGYDLDWRAVSDFENDEASRLAAEEGDLSALVSIFSRIASPCDPSRPLNADMFTERLARK